MDAGKVNIKANLVFLLIFLVVVAFNVFLSYRRDSKMDAELDATYPWLTYSDNVNSKILSAFYPEGWRNGEYIQHIKLESGKNYGIWIRNSIPPTEAYFGNIVARGMFLKKNAGSDTLVVISGQKEYKFLIYDGGD